MKRQAGGNISFEHEISGGRVKSIMKLIIQGHVRDVEWGRGEVIIVAVEGEGEVLR